MLRNRPSRLLASLCLAVLLAGITAPVFADPETGSSPSLGSLWRALGAWLDSVITVLAGGEANHIPYVDPAGYTGTTSSGEANHIPFVDPYGYTGTTSSGEANHIPWPDPAG